MPTLHRLSVFRDDLVFLVYIYQRWVYRVDKRRANEFGCDFTGQIWAHLKADGHVVLPDRGALRLDRSAWALVVGGDSCCVDKF